MFDREIYNKDMSLSQSDGIKMSLTGLNVIARSAATRQSLRKKLSLRTQCGNLNLIRI